MVTVTGKHLAQGFMAACLILPLAACGDSPNQQEKELKTNTEQAISRARQIIHQATGHMTPRPTFELLNRSIGKCLDPTDDGSENRAQVRLSYWLKEVPGNVPASLVKQARDAWVAIGYRVTQDGRWSDPFPTVNLRSVPDDFWMEATAGALKSGSTEGLASISVTSPCF